MSFFMSKTKTVFISAGFALIALSNGQADEVSSESTYDWTGVYVGGYVGGASGQNVSSSAFVDTVGNAGYWNQFYDPANNNYITSASFIGGGTLGYNWQLPNTAFLIGLEGEYGYLGMQGSNGDPTAEGVGSNAVGSIKTGNSYGYGLVGGRVGYSFDRALIYVKSGAVFTNTQISYVDSGLATGGNPVSATSKSDTTSYAIGAGIEYALPFEWSENISVKTEYLYFAVDTNLTTSFDGGPYGQLGSTYTSNTSISGIHTAKIGLNYKF